MILAQFEALYAWVITTAIPAMAVAYCLSYLGGLLLGGDVKEVQDEPRGQSFAWNPHTTMQEGIVRPLCFGRNLHYGNVVADWTDVDPVSGNEILYKILDYGGGPIQGVEGGVVSDENYCLDGTPTFNKLLDNYIDNWWQTAANVNDDDKTTYVGFKGEEGYGHTIKGRFEAIVEFDSVTIDRVDYRRYWRILGDQTHSGYEKIYLYYEGAYHLVATKSFTTEGYNTDTVVVEAGGPWAGVTKVKIEVELSGLSFWFRSWKTPAIIDYRLYELRAWSLGDVPVYLNGQPAHNFTEATVQSRVGTLNQTCMKGFEKNKLQSRPRTLIVNGEPVRWTSPNNFFDDIEYTLSWPRGLFYYDKEGKVRTHGIGVKVEVSERDADSWTEILNTTVSAAQLQPLYKAYSVNTQLAALAEPLLEHGKQYDLRYTKTTADKAATRYGDELKLRSLREVVDEAFTRPGRALLGVTVHATERLSDHVDVKWISDDKLCNVFEEGEWVIKFTRNRAWIYLAQLTQPIITGDGDGEAFEIERFEGLDPSRVDLDFIYTWAQWCDAQVPSGVGEETENRMPCDIICDQLTSVWSITYEVARIGRMTPYWRGTVLTGWIDEAVPEAETFDLVTFDNIMLRSWKSSYAGYGEMAGNAEVFYKDALQGYERKSRPASNENAGLYTRIIQLEAVGVTGAALATRVGNFALKRNELIKNVNSTRMYKAALRYKLGKVVRLQATVPGWGQAFRVIKSETNDTVEFDRVVTGVVEDNIIFIRSYDTIEKKVVVKSYTVESSAGKVITIKETWDAGCTPVLNDSTAIGVDGDIVKRRIVKMGHSQQNYFDVEFETYDGTLYGSDDTDPGLTNPDYLWSPAAIPSPITRHEVMGLIAAVPLPSIDRPILSNCKFVGDDVDTVSWSKRNPDEPILLRLAGTTHEIDPDSTTLEFIYWDPETPTVFQDEADAAVALAAGNHLVCRNKDGVEYPADLIQSQSGAIIQPKTITAALGQIDDLTVDTLQIIDQAVTQMVAAYTSALETHNNSTAWWEAQTITMETTGASVMLVFSVQWKGRGDNGVNIRIQRDDTTNLYSANMFAVASLGNPFCAVIVDDSPSAGEHTYDLDLQVTNTTVGDPSLSFKNRSIAGKEVKK